jgi:hypothetical protein
MTSEEIVISYIASWSAADTAERDRLLERCCPALWLSRLGRFR